MLFVRKIIIEIVTGGLIVFVLLELALRLFPALVPLPLLVEFPEGIRGDIALRRGLPLMREAITFERSDGGAPIRLQRPFAVINYDFKDPGIVKSVTVDAQGFCNPPEQSYERPDIDIIALGDSFTWCFAVNPQDTWVSQLGDLSGRSVYSLGLFAMGFYEYLELFRRFGVDKSPKLVIFNAYEGNDLFEAESFKNYRMTVTAAGKTAPAKTPCVLPPVLCEVYRFTKESWLGRSSYALNLLSHSLRLGLDRVSASLRVWRGKAEGPKPALYYTVDADQRIRFEDPSHAMRYLLAHGEEILSGRMKFDQLTEALEGFVELSQKHKFAPIVSYTPAAYTVYARSISFEEEGVAEVLSAYSRGFREFLSKKAVELGYKFIDLTPALQQAAVESEKLLYYPSNLHLTASGHRAVAEILAPEIERIRSVARP